jgi:hypothetical protein
VFNETDETTAVNPNCSQHVVFAPDPRLTSLGSRLLLPRGLSGAYLEFNVTFSLREAIVSQNDLVLR